ncbi:unnamed protein product [Blepharisma stoltei]|uniref:Uncharacterized protein n=1 Tax=Blepharisma stoltei TaxID=1481888 RepID=A0AAU9JY18_9CILI|nr:unnamed protein product [Blepharisma stoltei]
MHIKSQYKKLGYSGWLQNLLEIVDEVICQLFGAARSIFRHFILFFWLLILITDTKFEHLELLILGKRFMHIYLEYLCKK